MAVRYYFFSIFTYAFIRLIIPVTSNLLIGLLEQICLLIMPYSCLDRCIETLKYWGSILQLKNREKIFCFAQQVVLTYLLLVITRLSERRHVLLF